MTGIVSPNGAVSIAALRFLNAYGMTYEYSRHLHLIVIKPPAKPPRKCKAADVLAIPLREGRKSSRA